MNNLAPCSDCGKEISKAAAVCPHCGRRRPNEAARTKRHTIIGVIVGVLIVAGIVVAVWNDQREKAGNKVIAEAQWKLASEELREANRRLTLAQGEKAMAPDGTNEDILAEIEVIKARTAADTAKFKLDQAYDAINAP